MGRRHSPPLPFPPPVRLLRPRGRNGGEGVGAGVVPNVDNDDGRGGHPAIFLAIEQTGMIGRRIGVPVHPACIRERLSLSTLAFYGRLFSSF